MGCYILVDGKYESKNWWNELIRVCAVIGEMFEIHCWSDESAEIRQALRYGEKSAGAWHGGITIRGRITKEFISFLTEAPKPEDTQIYNKMTPFFTIILGDRLHSEHYGTEMIISKAVRENLSEVEQILKQIESDATIHRNIG